MDTPTIVYRVDGEDRIVAVNGAWNAFASANGGGAITASRIIGRNLFEFVTDATTQQLYRQMLARIRGGQDLTYTYRCDSPDRRRLMEMEMRLVDDAGSVEFRSVPLEERHVPRSTWRRPTVPTTARTRSCSAPVAGATDSRSRALGWKSKRRSRDWA